jgi:hypothetical protein
MKAFERIAFSLVTLFGLTCFAVVVYGSSAEAREVVHEVVHAGSSLPVASCSMNVNDPCPMVWLN